jgi:uncharacterized protein (TIGR02147 family)
LGTFNHSYRQVLLAEFQSRTRRNPAYSLRAFSRDLGIPASNLSNILNRKRGLSLSTARKIAGRFGMDSGEEERFLAQVQMEHGRSAAVRREARLRLKRGGDRFSEIALDQFELIANWIYFAILELTHVEGFQSQPAWIGRRLSVREQEAAAAVERLLRLGLLERAPNGCLRETGGDVATPSGDVPSRAVREHHRQVLHKADEALERVPPALREFAAVTFAFDSSQIEKAKRLLKKFRRAMTRDLQSSRKKDRVYCLSMQLFPMDIEGD